MIKFNSYPTILAVLTLLSGCYEEPFDPDKLMGYELTSMAYTLESCHTRLPWYLEGYARCVDIEERSGNLFIRTNSIPPHQSFYFREDELNFSSPQQSFIHDAENKIQEKYVTMLVPKGPKARDIEVTQEMLDHLQGSNEYEYPTGVVGMALNGVPFIKFHEQQQYQPHDEFHGHTDAKGTYHYDGLTPGALEVLYVEGSIDTAVVGEAEKELYGIMCDGTIVLGCTELNGKDPDSSDFDAQNGHRHTMKRKFGKSFLKNRYHVHICPEKIGGWDKLPEIQFYEECDVGVSDSYQ